MLHKNTSQHSQNISNSENFKKLPEGIITHGEVKLGGHVPRNSSKGAREPQIFPWFRKGDLIEQIEEVAFNGERGSLVTSCHCVGLLQKGSARAMDWLWRDETHTLQSIKLVFLSIEVVLVVGIEGSLALVLVA